MIAARQTERGKTERNDRLLGVAVHSHQHHHVTSIKKDVNSSLLSQVEEFFVSYNRQRGKQFKVTTTSGPGKAIELLKAGISAHRKQQAS